MTDVLRIRRRLAGVGTAGAPTSLMTAELAFNENDGTLYYGRGDNGSQQAVTIIPIAGAGMGGGASVTIADTPPVGPSAGNLWWNSSAGVGQLYIYFNDGTSSQWVIANNASGGLYLPLTGGTVTGLVTFTLAQTTSPAIILADSSGNGRMQIGGVATIAGNNTGALTITATPGLTLTGTLAVSGATTLAAATHTGQTTLAAATGVTMATADSSLNLATTAFVKNQAYAVAANYLPLTGGTLSGQLNGTSCTFSGNVIGNNSVQSNGVYFQNSSGWFYTPQNFVAGGAVAVSGQTGFNWQYSGGWMYTPNPLQAAGRIYTQGDVAAAGVLRVGGDGSGYYWQQNGGWMYCPNSLLIGGNINTHEIQLNGNNLDGCSNAYVSGSVQLPNSSATGGWGYVYGWASGWWTGVNYSDLLYTYNNTGFQGGCYWTYCDERLKWDIQPATRDCLAAINAIELKSFDFTDEVRPSRTIKNYSEATPLREYIYEDHPPRVKHFEVGFIAQQLREHIPDAVQDPPPAGEYYFADLRPLIAHLIGAVQQLTKQNAAQTARIEALEAR